MTKSDGLPFIKCEPIGSFVEFERNSFTKHSNPELYCNLKSKRDFVVDSNFIRM